MKTKLTCPVCSRPEIEEDICPNCETDLSTMRMLAELPPAAPIPPALIPQQQSPAWMAIVAILILVLGITLGTGGYSLISQGSSSNPTVTVTTTNPPLTNPVESNRPSRVSNLDGFRYKVRRGDSLSLIAGRFYGDVKLWSLIVEANPSLKGRENSLSAGEVLLVPNREED